MSTRAVVSMKTTDHKMHRTEERKTLAETVAMDVHPKMVGSVFTGEGLHQFRE